MKGDLVTKVIELEIQPDAAKSVETKDDDENEVKAWELQQRMRAREYREVLRRKGRLNG